MFIKVFTTIIIWIFKYDKIYNKLLRYIFWTKTYKFLL